ncbi:DUF5819 family protein [Streptomyces sp. NPDC047928]|uniref:DUF5819 family protein n=1 Tax=unclassified Streptomyces TaxID=2593676 RepID=UPI003710D30C
MDSYDEETGRAGRVTGAGGGVHGAPKAQVEPGSESISADGDADAGAPPAGRDAEVSGRDGAPAGAHAPNGATGGGIAALSLPYQVVAAVALAVVGVLGCLHLGMVFLHVAPSNTLTKQHGKAVDDWVFPEFEQNWKLFAPNPLQQNIAVHVRAEVTTGGTRRTTDWIDLTADDAKAIRSNPLPSHINQNELRRGWDFFVNSHTSDNRPNGTRGRLSEQYVRRIAMLRLEQHDLGGRIERIQLRSSTQGVPAPVWSDEKTDTRPYYRVLPWWTVTAADLPAGVDGGRTEAGE